MSNTIDNQKLELKHLAPYLPYDLKCLNEIGEIFNSLKLKLENPKEDCTIEHLLDYNFYKIKPILKPLSDILEDDDTILEIYSNSLMAGEYKISNSETRICIENQEDNSVLSIWLNKPHCNMEWINDILYSHHYDLKGLIEKGLAVPYNQTKQ